MCTILTVCMVLYCFQTGSQQGPASTSQSLGKIRSVLLVFMLIKINACIHIPQTCYFSGLRFALLCKICPDLLIHRPRQTITCGCFWKVYYTMYSFSWKAELWFFLDLHAFIYYSNLSIHYTPCEQSFWRFFVWHWLTIFGTWVYHHEAMCRLHSWFKYNLELWPCKIYRVFDMFSCPAHNLFLDWHWFIIFGTWVHHHKTIQIRPWTLTLRSNL